MENKPALFIRILLPFCMGIVILHNPKLAKFNLLLNTMAVLLFILLLIIRQLYHLYKVYHYRRIYGYLWIFFVFLMGGACCNSNDLSRNPQLFSYRPTAFLRIWIADEPQQTATTVKFRAEVTACYQGRESHCAVGRILVVLNSRKGENTALKYGTVCMIPATCVPVPSPLNSGEFNFRLWLERQNIYHQIYLQPKQLVLLHQGAGSAMVKLALSLRQRQVEIYRKLIRDDAAFAVASSLILGYRADLDKAVMDAYSRTGTIHALSVSGMHVGLIYIVLEWALSWMNRKTLLRWGKVCLMLLLIWWYALLTGYSPSVLRSAVMLSCFILGKSFQRHTRGYHTLALSAFGLLVWNPFLLWDAGFQLSYLSVFGLIFLYPKIYSIISFRWAILQKLWGMVAVSLAAQLTTFPLSIYYFHQFPVYFLLSNLYISIPVTLLMYVGLIILLFRLYWLAGPFEWLITVMNNGLDKIAQLPYSTIDQIWWSNTELFLLSTALILLYAALSGRIKLLLWPSLLLFLCMDLLLAKDHINAMNQRKIILFSVKKKYAVAFINGHRADIISDLAANENNFRFHIQPALDQHKVTELHCIPWGKDLSSRQLVIKEKQVRFFEVNILMADSSFRRKRIINRPEFDVIWFHGLSESRIRQIRRAVKCDRTWIDETKVPLIARNAP